MATQVFTPVRTLKSCLAIFELTRVMVQAKTSKRVRVWNDDDTIDINVKQYR